jgi:hypothetical protein
MEDNIIQTPNGTVILNGGNALNGCPLSWEEAGQWEKSANLDKDEFDEPLWKFDCGFKLDFDGPVLRVSSRFYPPKTHYGPTWDGNVTVYILGKEVEKKSFDCKTLNELKAEVEQYITSLGSRISLNPTS